MHGREQREGENEVRRRSSSGQHMRSVPPSATTSRTVVAGDSAISSITSDSFCKDGRKISVGDCALFKPPQNSLPFIGAIRRLQLSKENSLQLGVNWLYRPAELELGKGILLEAAPNEIFYSFHEDVIPAASLLHPCKVAFLPKGVDLPAGISSFVSRRVYDIRNKCLWWLTDQDYINERQEEVDHLLQKTRLEMHATVQPGGRSPKTINGPTSATQLKSGSDNVQNSVNSVSSQVKGKKRERVDQGLDPVKRERCLKTDDGDYSEQKNDSMLKSEIAKLSDKGGLVDPEGVEKLIQLMHPDRLERKMDLISRSMLAGVIAATEKFDCLNKFVQLKGLPVLDEWLQDVHKGKIGENNSSKDGDKSVEELLLVLLRALDKLPVNLHALQMCNIGKSVNHLRSHKNLEIQRKARSLVDTWKKRVEAEMNIIDAKSGSAQAVPWPSKSRMPEASHGGNKYAGGSDVATKSPVTHVTASKSTIRTAHGDTTAKSATSSPGPIKSASSPVSSKEAQPRTPAGAASDVPFAREDKSSSSSQSHNHSQSFSGKEDARSSTAGSISVNKISGSSRHRKSANGFPGAAVSGGQKETASSRNSLHRNVASEKLSQSGVTSERPVDTPSVEGSSHKLIVKIPNRGRSPAQSASGGYLEDPAIMSSRASSPVLSEKQDQLDRNLKERSDAYRSNVTFETNTRSWQSNDFKEVLTGSDEGDASPVTIPEDGRSRTEDNRRATELSKLASSSTEKLHDASFSSMNALIESCVKYSEANTSMSLGDAGGMNLLASVATEEMSKSGLMSPAGSPVRDTSRIEEIGIEEEAKPKPSPEENTSQLGGGDETNIDDDKQVVADDVSRSEGGLHTSKHSSINLSAEKKLDASSSGETPGFEFNREKPSGMEPTTAESCMDIKDNFVEIKVSTCHTSSCSAEKVRDSEEDKQNEEKTTATDIRIDGNHDSKAEGSNSPTDDRVHPVIDDSKEKTEVLSKKVLCDDECIGNEYTKGANAVISGGQMPSSLVVKSDDSDRTEDETSQPNCLSAGLTSEDAGHLTIEEAGDCSRDHVNLSEIERSDQDVSRPPVPDDRCPVESGFTAGDQKTEGVEKIGEPLALKRHSGVSPHVDAPAFSGQAVERHSELVHSKLSVNEPDKKEDSTSTVSEAGSLMVPVVQDVVSKVNFDLNEGLTTDDGKYGEPINLPTPGSSSSVQVPNALPFPVSAVSASLPASITIAAAAKGGFVPPEDLLRCKKEIGWKGSAATSAFRPAEPRKVLEQSCSSTSLTQPDVSTSKRARPLLDFDLNVPDERVFEEMAIQDFSVEMALTSEHAKDFEMPRKELSGSSVGRTSGGLDLDLNRVDDASEIAQSSASCSRKPEGAAVKSLSSARLSATEVRRDFDLNNGPVVEDAGGEHTLAVQNGRGSMQSQSPITGLRINSREIGNFSTWFPPGNSYSTVTIPSILPERGEQTFSMIPPGPQRILGPTGGAPFTPDVFRGSVLSSSPAMPFPSGPFQYSVFPFGATFPLPSASFSSGSASYMDSSSTGRLFAPTMNSQLLAPVASISSQYPRPYVVSLPEGSSSAAESSRTWGRQSLDLNAGPGTLDVEGREDALPIGSRQLPVASSQAIAEEQARLYSIPGSIMKRKEPEGGWDGESFRYKQPSWQ